MFVVALVGILLQLIGLGLAMHGVRSAYQSVGGDQAVPVTSAARRFVWKSLRTSRGIAAGAPVGHGSAAWFGPSQPGRSVPPTHLPLVGCNRAQPRTTAHNSQHAIRPGQCDKIA